MISRLVQLCPVVYGPGAISQVGEICKEMGITRAFIVTGPHVKASGVVKKAEEAMDAAGIAHDVYDGCERDAPDYTVEAAGNAAKAFGADGIIGIGGGSSLDSAKAVSVFAGNDITMDELLAVPPVPRPQLANIMIPTTAGTGSESTMVAVITNTQTHYKTGVFANPAFAIVDPELEIGLGEDITRYTGLDALSHANEALSSDFTENPMADVIAYDAFDRIYHWLPVALKDPDNAEAREHLAIASNGAGRAFTNAATHLGHAIAHALGANYHIIHGYACAWVTPVILEYMADAVPEKYLKVAKLIGCRLSTEDPEIFPGELAAYLRDFMRGLGMKSPKDCGVTREMMIDCADYTEKEAMAYFGKKKPDRAKIEELLAKVWDDWA